MTEDVVRTLVEELRAENLRNHERMVAEMRRPWPTWARVAAVATALTTLAGAWAVGLKLASSINGIVAVGEMAQPLKTIVAEDGQRQEDNAADHEGLRAESRAADRELAEILDGLKAVQQQGAREFGVAQQRLSAVERELERHRNDRVRHRR